MNSLSTSQVAQILSTTIRTNPHLYATNTFPNTGTQNIQHLPPTSHVNNHTTSSSTLPLTTISNPSYINSLASISEPMKPFDGVDHKYTLEEYLQHIEAPVTFSLGLQPSTEHEYKLWHPRCMAFNNDPSLVQPSAGISV